MTLRNVIQTTFDEFGKAEVGSKKSGSWYRRSPETIVVLNLQKSQYGLQYYINVAVWLCAAGLEDAPKTSHCHVQTRLGRLVPPALAERLTELLNLDSAIDDDARREGLLGLMREYLLPMMEAASTLDGLRSGEGERFVKESLVNRDGLRLLASAK